VQINESYNNTYEGSDYFTENKRKASEEIKLSPPILSKKSKFNTSPIKFIDEDMNKITQKNNKNGNIIELKHIDISEIYDKDSSLVMNSPLYNNSRKNCNQVFPKMNTFDTYDISILSQSKEEQSIRLSNTIKEVVIEKK